jgi:hypothetical protein
MCNYIENKETKQRKDLPLPPTPPKKEKPIRKKGI